jgi:N-acetylglucosamine kinase-like BadF-type ATPase
LTHPSLVLGIDGGGTKTVAWLALRAEGLELDTVVGRGAAGGSNLQTQGAAGALANLDAAIDAAFADARLPRGAVAACVAAVAGSDRDENRRIFTQWAAERQVADWFRVTHDAEPVLAAGSPAGWGVALIAGTGSLAFARAPDGATARAGGWGYLFGDEGSGYWIALEGLRAAAHAADQRGPPTRLLDFFIQRLGVSNVMALIPAVYGLRSSEMPEKNSGAQDRAAIAALADVVFRAADEGDEQAGAILDRAADALAGMAAAAARRARINEPIIPLAVTGGVLLNHRSLFDATCRRLVETHALRFETGRVANPVWGAVLLARRQALAPVDKQGM